MEVWKVIPEFEDYQASDMGNIRRISDGRILNKTKMYRGYLHVGLSNSGKRYCRFVQTIVLSAHVGPKPFPKAVAMHLNDDKEDNRLINLKWDTQSNNMKTAYEKGRKKVVFIPAKGKFGKYSKSAKPIEQIDKSTGAIVKKFESIIEASRELNISDTHITSCCKGRLQHAYGFKWRYAS